MIRLIKLIIWIAIISGGIFFWKYSSYQDTQLEISQGPFTVTPGSNFRSILVEAGATEIMTKIYLQNNTPDFQLQAGNYLMIENPTVSELLSALKKPINETDEFITFLEGWNIFDIDQYLTQKQLISAGEFISYAENFCNPELYPSSTEGSACDVKIDFTFLADVESLEGYLYPDTYAINPSTFTVKSLAVKMLTNFESKIINSGVISDMGSIEMQDIIILASIVEKEERDPVERPTVAGILKKRLDEGWMIGADITVCYPFRLTAEECKLSVTKYLYEVNDYNTRQKVGLPAGPIGNPSVESIAAVVNPVETEYYYYLHDTVTGKIYYGRTNAEHDRNKQLYLR